MVRPLGQPLARRAVTLEDLREEFLVHCETRNLSGRTLEWYSDRTHRFADWCATRGIEAPSDLRWSDLEEFVLDRRHKGFAPNTVHGYAQPVVTTGIARGLTPPVHPPLRLLPGLLLTVCTYGRPAEDRESSYAAAAERQCTSSPTHRFASR